MVKKPESKLWHKLRDNLPSVQWTRFENWAVPGVPDVHGIDNGIDIFIELKITKNNKINLSPFQISWNYKHSLKGGRNFIMAEHIGLRALCVFPGSIVHSIGSIGLDARPIYQWDAPLARSSWQEIHELLFHSPLPRPEAK